MLYGDSRQRVEIVTLVTESSNYHELYGGTRLADHGYQSLTAPISGHVQLFHVIKLIPKMSTLTAIVNHYPHFNCICQFENNKRVNKLQLLKHASTNTAAHLAETSTTNSFHTKLTTFPIIKFLPLSLPEHSRIVKFTRP
jgi:hypothetical protein